MKKIRIKFYIMSSIIFFLNIEASKIIRNPFTFANFDYNKINLNAIAKINNSKSFAVIKTNDNFNIIKPGDNIFGYNIYDIKDNCLIIKDNNNNELIIAME